MNSSLNANFVAALSYVLHSVCTVRSSLNFLPVVAFNSLYVLNSCVYVTTHESHLLTYVHDTSPNLCYFSPPPYPTPYRCVKGRAIRGALRYPAVHNRRVCGPSCEVRLDLHSDAACLAGRGERECRTDGED